MVSIKEVEKEGNNYFELSDDGKICSRCFFNPESSEILSLEILEKTDENMLLALIKAVLNNLDHRGHKETFVCKCETKVFENILLDAGFINNGGKYNLMLDGYFDHQCCGDHNDV